MRNEIGRIRALLNAVLVLAVLGLAGFGVVQISARHWQWQETFRAQANFATIAGLELGGRVRVQGIDAGVVESIVPPSAPGKPVALIMRLDARLRPLVRSDAVARIGTQGIVGAKIVEILPGKPDAPPLGEGGSIRTESPLELADLLKDASTSLKRLDVVATDAHTGLAEINAIAANIRKGKGSLGRLVQDDEAYNKLVALSTRGERTLNDLEENLAALKRTWPLSRYFNERAFFDRDRVLFQPGSERESRTFTEAELFEPGRAVLTSGGRQRLDQLATWFKTLRRPKSTEIVIASFTDDDSRGEDLALILTQEQAESVRKYLVSQHALDSNGWWSSRRRIAAVGFGTQAPPSPDAVHAALPARRVEVILFTPQT
jgi:phospholipid/cholesterol/gamma-HCH transport system substrate-binding protein